MIEFDARIRHTRLCWAAVTMIADLRLFNILRWDEYEIGWNRPDIKSTALT